MNDDDGYEFVIVAGAGRYAILEYVDGQRPVCLEIGYLCVKPIRRTLMTAGDVNAVDEKTIRRILDVVDVGEIPASIYDEVASAFIQKSAASRTLIYFTVSFFGV